MPFKPVNSAVEFVVGPLIDDTDFKTRETAIAFNAPGMSVHLLRENHEGVATATAITPTEYGGAGVNPWRHLGNGYYGLTIDIEQNNTLGDAQIVGFCTGVLPFRSAVYTIVPTAVFAAMVANNGRFPAALSDELVEDVDGLRFTAAALSQVSKTGYELADGAITAAKIATDAISADKIAADAVTKLQAGLSTLTAQDVADAAKLTPSPGDPHLGSLKSQVDICASEANKAALYSTLVHQRLPVNPAAVGSAMTLAADQDVRNVTGNVAGSVGSVTAAVTVGTNNDKSGYTLSASGVQAIWEYASRSLTTFGTLVSEIATAVWSWFSRTITGGSLTTSPPTAAQIADAVWDETLADHAGAGSTGAALSGATAPTAAAIADAVWDEEIAGHATAGSTGAALAAAQSAGDPWATELPGSYGSGTAGKIIGNIDSQLESIANRTQIPG